jgi:hypothetical protein
MAALGRALSIIFAALLKGRAIPSNAIRADATGKTADGTWTADNG